MLCRNHCLVLIVLICLIEFDDAKVSKNVDDRRTNHWKKPLKKRGAGWPTYTSNFQKLNSPWKKELSATFVEKLVPVPVAVKVPVDRPVPKPYPVAVEKPVPVPYKVQVPQPYPVYKRIPVPVKIPVDRPVPVIKPYPVYVEKQIPYPVDKPVAVPVNVPYPIYVGIEKNTEKAAFAVKWQPEKTSFPSAKSVTSWFDKPELSSSYKLISEDVESDKWSDIEQSESLDNQWSSDDAIEFDVRK